MSIEAAVQVPLVLDLVKDGFLDGESKCLST